MESYTDLKRYLKENDAYLNSLGLKVTDFYLVITPANYHRECFYTQNVRRFLTAQRVKHYSLRRGNEIKLKYKYPAETHVLRNLLTSFGGPSTAHTAAIYFYGVSVLVYVKHFTRSWVAGRYDLLRQEHDRSFTYKPRQY